MPSSSLRILSVMLMGLCLAVCSPAYAIVPDTYFEDFSNFTKGATVDGVDYWKVLQGASSDAIVTNEVYYPSSTQSLKVVGAKTNTIVGRSAAYYPDLNPPASLYFGLTPTWVRFRVRPSYGAQTPSVPATGIAAVCFDYTGNLLASNGKAWFNTGQSYATDQWYEVILKLDFLQHTYDVYFLDATVANPQFVAIKTGLAFIDPTVTTVSALKFYGEYASGLEDDVYVDFVSVDYIYRLEVITPSQRLLRGQESGLITVQLQNILSEPQTTYKDITLDLKSTSLSGRFSLTLEPWVDVTQIVLPKMAQDVSFYYKDDKAGRPIINVAQYPNRGCLDALYQIEVISDTAAFEVEAASTQVAGQEFEIKIKAKDDEGNINTSYGGTVLLSPEYVSPDTGRSSITPLEVSGFTDGIAKAVISYPDCGTAAIDVVDKDDPDKIGKSAPILFLPADFVVSAEDKQIVARPFNLSVTARNALGQIAPNYNGTVNLSAVPVKPESVSGAALTPASVSGSQFEAGKADVNVAYNRYGTIKIKGADSADATKQGITGEMGFLPKAVSVEVEFPSGRDFFYVGEPVGVTLKVLDNAGGAVVNYTGPANISSQGGLSVPSQYNFTLGDAGQHKFSASSTKAGEYTIGVSIEDGSLNADSQAIKVKEAYLQVIDTTSPIGTGEVIIQLVDEEGNVISSENGLIITVETQEETDNSSSSLSSRNVTLKEGKAIITVSDTEAETVTISASSAYKIKTRKGKIVFGQIGRTGISSQMWRELKEK